jgi:hypothetical protein
MIVGSLCGWAFFTLGGGWFLSNDGSTSPAAAFTISFAAGAAFAFFMFRLGRQQQSAQSVVDQFSDIVSEAQAGAKQRAESARAKPELLTPNEALLKRKRAELAETLFAERAGARKPRSVRIVFAVAVAAVVCVFWIGLGGKPNYLALISVGFIAYKLLASDPLSKPHVVLVLRRFGKRNKDVQHLADSLGEACSGLATPLTIQDQSFEGPIPIGSQLLKLVVLPLAVSAVVLVTIQAALTLTASAQLDTTVAWAAVLSALVTWWGGSRLIIRYGVYRGDRHNYVAILESLFTRVGAAKHRYVGTIVMQFSDDCWQEAIELCLKRAHGAIIDVTDMTDNLAWEIRKTFALLPSEAILVTWDNSRLRTIRGYQQETADSWPAACAGR